MRSITVTATTMGQGNPAHVDERKNYRFRGDPDWPANRSRYEDGGDLACRRAANAGGEVGAEARRRRLAEFTAALADLGEPDPEEAPNAKVIEAGKRVGVTAKTAKAYRTALRKQRLREEAAPGEVPEDAEPHEIVAGIHERIAGFSARHASLVAEYGQLQRRPGYRAEEPAS